MACNYACVNASFMTLRALLKTRLASASVTLSANQNRFRVAVAAREVGQRTKMFEVSATAVSAMWVRE
jgi:hypothetical protein